jgi:putative CocE/NonD family hydrolase
VEQSGLCERDDVLTFHSEVLAESLLIEGAINVQLDVSSSVPDTAFTAKLIEVFPDGRSFNIRDSITTLAFSNGSEVRQDYQPGARLALNLKFWPIAWRVQPGSRLRLDVSSSDFPKFHAHTNRAGPWADQAGADIAEQVVYGGRIALPVGR